MILNILLRFMPLPSTNFKEIYSQPLPCEQPLSRKCLKVTPLPRLLLVWNLPDSCHERSCRRWPPKNLWNSHRYPSLEAILTLLHLLLLLLSRKCQSYATQLLHPSSVNKTLTQDYQLSYEPLEFYGKVLSIENGGTSLSISVAVFSWGSPLKSCPE
jgi:hypothetical protein